MAHVDAKSIIKDNADYQSRLREAAKAARPGVVPHWLKGHDTFWYRLDKPNDRSQFVFVDARKGLRRPAFDHIALAKQLSREFGRPVSADSLPFQWLDLEPDGSSMHFRAEGQRYKLHDDGRLSKSKDQHDENEPEVEILDGPKPSQGTDTKTSVTFVNHCSEEVCLVWLDYDANPVEYSTVSPGQTHTQSTFEGHVWSCVFKNGTTVVRCRAVAQDATLVLREDMQQTLTINPPPGRRGPAPAPAKSPPPRVYVKDYNVWYRTPAGGEVQLSRTGSAENPFDSESIYLSPNERNVVVWQYTPEQTREVHYIESSPKDQLQPKHETIQYLKPGDRVRVDRPRIFSLDQLKEVKSSDDLFQNPFDIRDIGWDPNSLEYRFIFNARGHQTLRVLGMGWNGTVRVLVEEKSSTFIDYEHKLYHRMLDETKEMIWASERSGRNSLYLIDTNTCLVKNEITRGDYIVRHVEEVEEESRQIWVKVHALHHDSLYDTDLVRMSLDGSGLTILTNAGQAGDHSWSLSPHKRLLVDSWSRNDQPTRVVLRETETGRELIKLEQGDYDPLLREGWMLPEPFVAPGRDGRTPIYGVIIRPANFDPRRKYPIIEEIYAGPQGFHTPNYFAIFPDCSFFARHGFVSVRIDGMGTNWRHKAFHDVCYKNLKDAGIPDRIAWLRAAASTRPWMDLDRVGIWGNSAGGQNSTAAMLFHGDFYKAAVSDCGCHDNRIDKLWWSEAFGGWPVDQSYEDNSNAVHADKLQGALMLMVGEMDKNVDPSCTMQVVNALNKAQKYYELLVFPGGGHGEGSGSGYGKWRMLEFFLRHLIGPRG